MDTSPAAHPHAAIRRPVGVADVARLGTTLCVWAHPDDESYLGGGLAAALGAAGRRVVVVTATLGEAGLAGPVPRRDHHQPPPPSRAAELAAALRHLGVVEHHQLGFADGGCADVDPAAGAAALAEVIAAVRPDTVVTFGPDGFTGHPDHVTVGEWTRRAMREVPWGGRLLHPVVTEADRAAGRDVDDRFDVFGLGEPRVCRPDELAVRLDLAGDLLDRKLAALRAHHSQTALLAELVGADRYADWVSRESFAEASWHG